MLPLTLKLHNFLSYRENVPILHLEGIHLACLCGGNGTGKSALLDAITWAIWGRARSQRLDQLIHQGQQEMRVELEFEAKEQRYRVIRRYSRSGSRQASSLELAVAVGDRYQAITGNSLRATGIYLETLLAMDYETFVNSAFLVQGRADLFTMATPSQRKEVLAKVLGLGLYDRLEERSKAHARNAQALLEATGAVLQRLREQVSRWDELTDALDHTDAALKEVTENANGLEGKLMFLRTHVGQLLLRQEEAKELATQVERIEERSAEAKRELGDLDVRLSTWRTSLSNATETETGYQALIAARESLSTLHVAAQQLHGLERELGPLEQRIISERAILETESRTKKRQVQEELTPRVEALPGLGQIIERINAALLGLESPIAELANILVSLRGKSAQARMLEGDNRRIADIGRDIRSKIGMLTKDSDNRAIQCPLCGTELGMDARSRLEELYRHEIEAHSVRYREQEEHVRTLDKESLRLQQEIDGRQREVDASRQELIEQRARAQEQQEAAQQASHQLEQLNSLVSKTDRALEQGHYAQQEQARASEIRARIEQLAFKPEDQVVGEDSVRAAERWDALYRGLQEARTRLPEDELARHRSCSRLEEAARELEHARTSQAKIGRELKELPGLQNQLQAVELEHQRAIRARDELQAHRGSLMHQVEEIAQAQQDLQKHENELQRLRKEASAYTDLTQAFGKGGVQALLIEAAIPRLEEETNTLLRRMTNGRMSLKMETQRARRTGRGHGSSESIETLEILIADELGTRNYEMFSGGENFRVNFALRVALSKLLAWRAGTRLPTLFIDEGFGTQDTDGRDRILDVIQSIEPDFQRILVITHMDEVKEAFPVRIEVTRSSTTGSTFTIV